MFSLENVTCETFVYNHYLLKSQHLFSILITSNYQFQNYLYFYIVIHDKIINMELAIFSIVINNRTFSGFVVPLKRSGANLLNFVNFFPSKLIYLERDAIGGCCCCRSKLNYSC